MTHPDYATGINRHYAAPNLAETIFAGLRETGKDPARLAYDDLGPVDQFHTGGKQTTAELARLANLKPGLRVLDVGGGIGGAARTLAAEFGCRVTVLDLTEEYCRVGELLTERTGLSAQLDFRCGNALAMPFADASFDLVWTQHSTMNVDNKEQLYREIGRVLRPEGCLAMHEIAAGPNRPIHFPVPWASEPALSFLRPVAETRALIEDSGFAELAFRDTTAAAREWFRGRLAAAAGTPPPLGIHLLLGETFRPAFQNQVLNLEENRIAVIQAVYRKRAQRSRGVRQTDEEAV